MRRTLLAILLLAASSLHAQDGSGLAGPAVIPVPYYPSGSVVDNYGNIIVFDFIYTNPPILPGQMLPALPAIPKTRVSVVPPGGGTVVTQEYSATFQIIGTGQWGVYAIGTVYTLTNNQLSSIRSLVAVDVGSGGVNLPPDFSGFPSTPLPPTGDAQLVRSSDGLPDTIYSVEPAAPQVVPRIARIITFNGTFKSTDVNLPQ